jgi:hypothetical protein
LGCPEKVENGFDPVFLDRSGQRYLIQLRRAIKLLLDNNMDITLQPQGAAINTYCACDNAKDDPVGCCCSVDSGVSTLKFFAARRTRVLIFD